MTDNTTEIAVAETTAPAIQQPSQTTDVMALIEKVVTNPNVDVDKMQALLDMQERVMDRQALIDFNAALAKAQSQFPVIPCDMKGNHEKPYPSLKRIMSEIKGVLDENGLAVSFDSEIGEKCITVTTVISHIAGHSEKRYSVTIPDDGSGGKNAVHAKGSASSYGQRYSIKGALNLVYDKDFTDDDGAGAIVKMISESQQEKMKEKILDCSDDVRSDFMTKYGGVSNIPADKYNALMAYFNRKAKENSDA